MSIKKGEGKTSWDSIGQMQLWITYFKSNPMQISVKATTIKNYLPLQMDWMKNVSCENIKSHVQSSLVLGQDSA